MALIPGKLICRQPIIDRNRELAFYLLTLAEEDYDTVTPFVIRLANIEIPQSVYFLPIRWVQDAVLLKKLARDMILVTPDGTMSDPIVEEARESGFRIAVSIEEGDARKAGGDFAIAPWGAPVAPSPDTIFIGLQSTSDESQAKATPAMYFSGHYLMESTPIAGGKRMNPSHALILELMGAVQQESEPKTIEAMFKRDVTLSFKLLRYINSPWFGLASRVESVRHALSIIGYQQLLKWLTLLAVTAGQEASPILTTSAMIRARVMELIGTKLLDKREADNLFVTGMLSLLDRLMGVPLEEILQYVNLPETVTDALIGNESRYSRYLQLALALEGAPLADPDAYTDMDTKFINNAHLEAIEWATQAGKIA